MPLATPGSTHKPDDNFAAASSSTDSSPVQTPRKWSHKKFGHRKRPRLVPDLSSSSTTESAPTPTVTAKPWSTTRPSPRREQKKIKRRESDAKWRSNLSVCFKHLETKVFQARNCFKTRLSKEMIVQKTVQKVQHLEALFMLLNQVDTQGKECVFSPLQGLQCLQSARQEFAHKFFNGNKQKPQGKSCTNTAVDNPDPQPPLRDGLVPDSDKPFCEQLVPPYVATTAGHMERTLSGNIISSNASSTATKQKAAQQDRAVPSTPPTSLFCEEQDLDPEDPSPKTPKFHATKGGFNGHISQGQVMTSPRRKATTNTAQTPYQSPIRSNRSVVPTTPSLYSPDRPKARSPRSYSHSASPAREKRKTNPCRPSNRPARSGATKKESVVPHWPAYWSPGKNPADSPSSSGLISPCKVPCWSPPGTPKSSPCTRHGGVALSYQPSSWSPASKVASKSSGVFGYQPPYSPAHSPVVHHGIADYIRPLEWSPTRNLAGTLASSPGRGYGSTALASSSDFITSSPSKRYKIVRKSVMSLGDAEPGIWQNPLSSKSDVTGKSTPDLTCQEEIPVWKEDKKVKQLVPYTTPTSTRRPQSCTTQPPSIPPKKRPATWSAKFVNDVRQSQPSLDATQTKSKRCKRLFTDGFEGRAVGQSNPKTQKFEEASISFYGSDDKKKAPRRKYHKRTTAARIRPWDPVTSKVSSPVCGITKQQSNSNTCRSKSPFSLAPSSAKSFPKRQPKTNPCIQDKTSRRKSQKPRKLLRGGGLRIVIKEEETANLELGVEEIIDVEEVELDGRTEDFCKTYSIAQPSPDISNHIDQDAGSGSSQGSLLLSEIQQLPDEIITPLLLSGESEQCFLEDSDLERTLQPDMYEASASTNHLKTSKSDDEIVLTILELEEESRSSASTRSSPDSIGNQPTAPTSATNLVSVLDQGSFADRLQGALMEAYQLMSCEAGTSGCPPTVILSPVRISKLGSLNGEPSPENTFYLVSPIKQEKEALGNAAKETGYLGAGGSSEVDITESMARFASSALRSQSLDPYSQQPKANQEASEVSYSDNENVYYGATQALLNGQIVGKTPSSLRANSYQTPSTLICVDSGTPTKKQFQLPYSVPPTSSTVPQCSSKTPETSYPTSDTNIHDQSPGISMSPSTSPPSTPRYITLRRLSQNSAENAFSPELPKEAYSLPLIKQEQWDWTEPPAINLQANESLDDLMSEDILARYYQTYACLGVEAAGQSNTEEGLIEVPDWQAEKTDNGSQSYDDFSSSTCMSSSSSLSSSLSPLVTGRISHSSGTSESTQSAEYQVVPNLPPDGTGTAGAELDTREDEIMGSQLGFQGLAVKSETEDSPGLQSFHCWLANQ